jgi:hypothetical protein
VFSDRLIMRHIDRGVASGPGDRQHRTTLRHVPALFGE